MRAPIFFILIATLSMAATAGLSGSVDPAGSASLVVRAEVPDAWGRTVTLALSGPVESVVVKDRSGLELVPAVAESGGYTQISVPVPSDYVEFAVVSDSFTSKNASQWNFDLLLGMSENISSFTASLKLPAGAVVKSTNGAVGGEGGTLAVSWEGKDIDPLHRAHLRAGYEFGAQPMPDLTSLTGLVALVLAFGIGYYLYSHPKAAATASQQQGSGIRPRASGSPHPASGVSGPQVPGSGGLPQVESNAVFKTLDETDREIVREILAEGGKTTQARIYLHTHVPKATLSRRLASLENRGIIVRSQKGNRNLVSLGEALLK